MSRPWKIPDSSKTHYETLGLKPDCSQDDIKKAFIDLTKEHHPDVAGGDTERSKRINVAYTVLSRVEDRRNYDLELDRNVWKANPVEDPFRPRPATYENVSKMYGFPSQASYQMGTRHSKNLLTAFIVFMGVGIFTSFFLTHRDHTKKLDDKGGRGSLDSDGYLGGDIVARRAARSHRRVRERTRDMGFDERLRFVEGAVLKRAPTIISTPEVTADSKSEK